jgi:hypothetical protein
MFSVAIKELIFPPRVIIFEVVIAIPSSIFDTSIEIAQMLSQMMLQLIRRDLLCPNGKIVVMINTEFS